MSKCNVEVYSRVTGFFQKVQGYNPGKKAEFKERCKYNIKNYLTKKMDCDIIGEEDKGE